MDRRPDHTNVISGWFWKRAVRHEMLSLARMASLVSGLLLIISGLIGAAPLAFGLILGVGVIIFSGRMKHRLWPRCFLAAGLLAFTTFGGMVGERGAILLIAAAALGLANTFV